MERKQSSRILRLFAFHWKIEAPVKESLLSLAELHQNGRNSWDKFILLSNLYFFLNSHLLINPAKTLQDEFSGSWVKAIAEACVIIGGQGWRNEARKHQTLLQEAAVLHIKLASPTQHLSRWSLHWYRQHTYVRWFSLSLISWFKVTMDMNKTNKPRVSKCTSKLKKGECLSLSSLVNGFLSSRLISSSPLLILMVRCCSSTR